MKNLKKILLILVLLFIAGTFIFFSYQNFIKPRVRVNQNRLVELYLNGGFIGFCDHLVIDKDGKALISNNCTNKQISYQIKTEELKQLKTLTQQFNKFTYESDDSAKADGLYTKLIFYGQGPNNPQEKQKDTILQLTKSILLQDRP